MPRQQAEAQVQVLAEIVEGELATKNDIRRDLKELEYRLVLKLSAIYGDYDHASWSFLRDLSRVNQA